MCLIKNPSAHKHNRPLIAKENIICYKFLKYWKKYDEYYTSVQNEGVPNKCIKEKVPFKAPILNIFKFIWNHILGNKYIVEEDFIHTYIKIHKVVLEPCDRIIFKCIISKGTLYYVGIDNDYASRQIIFLEPINIG